MFIAEVYAAIATRFKEFQSKNKAAKAAGAGGVKDKEMGLGSMRALITALPQYHEILQRMTLHIQVGQGAACGHSSQPCLSTMRSCSA